MSPKMPFKSADALVGERCRTMFARWKKLTGDRLAPQRKELTLALVANLAPWLWTANVIDKGADFQYRLVGDRLAQFFGTQLTSAPLSQLPSSKFIERTRQAFAYCVEHKRPIAIGPNISSLENKKHWEVEAVLLPLSEDGENVTSLVGVFDYWPAGSKSEAL